MLIDHIYFIFRAVFELNIYLDKRKKSITVVLRKLGKPSYGEAKVYRLIALLNTLGRLFLSIMADDLSHFCKSRNVFPMNQFEGRPFCTTSDSMLLMMYRIKEAWRNKKVALVLFLDIWGAFPNVVKEVPIHNMHLHTVPAKYVHLVELMLTGCKTKLSFNNFMSDLILINNGNNQGCPLSMIFYMFYNTGLLEISPPDTPDKQQFGYIDDIALLATGNSLAETHCKLADMMTCPGGAFDWSDSHHSHFELTKLAVMDFTTRPHQPIPLTLTHPHNSRMAVTNVAPTYKFLGVMFNPKLKWTHQLERASRSASAWINLVRQLAQKSMGIPAKGMCQLYISIALPKMSYAADIWYTIPHHPNGLERHHAGAIQFTQKLVSGQCKAVITILGAMKTTAGDVLNAHANLPPTPVIPLSVPLFPNTPSEPNPPQKIPSLFKTPLVPQAEG